MDQSDPRTAMYTPEANAASVTPGAVLLDKYLVEHELGKGGMSVILAVRHLDLGERFAMKLLLRDAMTEPGAVDRFLREAQVCARIHHEHLARVYDVGRLDGGTPYMIMEYLEGCNLQELVRKRGLLPVDDVLEYVCQACDVLAVMHEHGVVHRDIKLSNLFVARQKDGRLCTKVIDFGISKVSAPEVMALTRSGVMMGTPLYVSPEQLICAKDTSAPTDIWGIGVVLYELFTGEAPFDKGSFAEVIRHILHHEPPPPRQLRPDLPPWVDAVVMRCLRKVPEERFQSMDELASALRDRGEAPERSSQEAAPAERAEEATLTDMPFAVLVRQNVYDAVVVTRPVFTVGRSQSMDYLLRDGEVSRHHATLLRRREGIFVEDNGSSHGTLVNGIHVSQMKLRSGDVISVEKHALSVRICSSLDAAQQEVQRAAALHGRHLEATTRTVEQDAGSPHDHFLAIARRVMATCESPVVCFVEPDRATTYEKLYGLSIIGAMRAEIAHALSTHLPDSFLLARANGARIAVIATEDRAPQALAKVQEQVESALPLDVQVGSERLRFTSDVRAVSLDEALMEILSE